MANIPLKSIKFPDLADTYTVPSNAGELPYNKSATYPDDTVGKALQNIGDSSAPAIIETATGSIASFTDGANLPVKDLVVEIVPMQSGSGDPSPDNVRPITGWTEAEIHVADGESPHIVDNVTTISFASAGTVYGGTLDVTSGVLTVDRGFSKFSDNSWSYNAQRSYFKTETLKTIIKHSTSLGEIPNALCSMFKAKSWNSLVGSADDAFTIDNEGIVQAKLASAGSDATTFLSLVGNAELCFELETPQTYQLTPTEVKTLLKNNNIWADTGDVTVEYVADTKTFIENLVNA